MTRSSSAFAKGVIYLVGIAALVVCFILIPELVREESMRKSGNLLVNTVFLGIVYTIVTPFFVALHQALKLLKYIDQDKAFSLQSIKALQNIKKCALVFIVLIIFAVIGGMGLARTADPTEDVTFMVTFGVIFTFIATVIAVFVAVMQKLMVDAMAMKSENDLIV